MTVGKCDTCGKKKYGYLCEGCIHDPDAMDKYEPMTNADRFRAMSDEEQQKCVSRFWEIEDFADWLKQPAEEGENGA